MAHKFKGKDRRILKKGVMILQAVIKRDALALGTKKSTQISTRSLMLDEGGVGGTPLYTAATLLLSRFTSLLAM